MGVLHAVVNHALPFVALAFVAWYGRAIWTS
jgi:hypothetical protein